MAATIVDLATTSKEPMLAGVAEMFLQYNDGLKYVSYKSIGDILTGRTRVATLPSVGYRAINGSYSEGTATFEQMDESLSIIGGEIDVDVQLEGNASQMVSQATAQTEAKIKALAFKVGNDIINGDKASDPLSVDGLKVRIDNLPSRQLIAANGMDSLKIYTSAATQNTFLDLIDQAIDVLDGGVVDVVFADEDAIRGWFSVLRRVGIGAGVVDVSPMVIGSGVQNVSTVKMGTRQIKVIRTGFTNYDQATKVITTTEATGDGGTDGTSMYFCRLGDDYFNGLQKASMTVKSLGELQTQPANRTRIEWVMGYSNWNDRSLVRLKGLKFGT